MIILGSPFFVLIVISRNAIASLSSLASARTKKIGSSSIDNKTFGGHHCVSAI
jgi:hypothetical protein